MRILAKRLQGLERVGGRIHLPGRRSRDRGGRRRAAMNQLGNVSRTALRVTLWLIAAPLRTKAWPP